MLHICMQIVYTLYNMYKTWFYSNLWNIYAKIKNVKRIDRYER